VSHEFQLVEVPSKKTGKCRQEECQTATFQVNANDGQRKSLQPRLVTSCHCTHSFSLPFLQL
jgi:hypothetical protein